jgi:hypothetical protein
MILVNNTTFYDGGVTLSVVAVTEPPRGGVHRQDQLERFSVKREHNQHT